ncbi:unnamed protein product [Cuscuta epithymum]|uniref:Transposase-associated domain-containing protein n=1 Tax=Cuscuta epithymum TaxID=186058 RepID=A0AAV0FCY2_9ASTE|nr:unnamed protein product [Cuscuta epithymum]
MDKHWISCTRTTSEFQQGVEDFIQFAFTHRKEGEKLPCPCRKCGNMCKVSRKDELREHIFCNGFSRNYTEWIFHGEREMGSTINHHECHADHLNQDQSDENDQLDEMLHDMEDNFTYMPHVFDSIQRDAEKPLYEGCSKYTRLSAVLKLFNLKAANGLSDKGFTELLKLLKDMLPMGNELPDSTYQAKKILCPMGLEVEKIHVCPNDCVLYRKEYKNLKQCPRCGTSRYKVKTSVHDTKNGPPAKVLWYLPIVPRFKRLFANAKDAKSLTWHADQRKEDGMLRHPADSPQWKNIDNVFPDFGCESRNLRLGLCTDGINPFGKMNSQHSTWPVLLVIYNLAPWLCMKRKYMIMSLLISGPKQPGNDIDVYLAPLIEDLKMLWDEGVPVFDAYRHESFTLHAMVYCTINDFPAYGNLSSHTTKGYKACPICEDDVKAMPLAKSKKIVYLSHRRFLPRFHPYRRLRKAFDGEQEHGLAPRPLTGKHVFERVKGIHCIFGKPYKPLNEHCCYKKMSVFWNLPYWEHLSVRHCIDVMHVEKNVFDSLIGTLLNMPFHFAPSIWQRHKESGFLNRVMMRREFKVRVQLVVRYTQLAVKSLIRLTYTYYNRVL